MITTTDDARDEQMDAPVATRIETMDDLSEHIKPATLAGRLRRGQSPKVVASLLKEIVMSLSPILLQQMKEAFENELESPLTSRDEKGVKPLWLASLSSIRKGLLEKAEKSLGNSINESILDRIITDAGSLIRGSRLWYGDYDNVDISFKAWLSVMKVLHSDDPTFGWEHSGTGYSYADKSNDSPETVRTYMIKDEMEDYTQAQRIKVCVSVTSAPDTEGGLSASLYTVFETTQTKQGE